MSEVQSRPAPRGRGSARGGRGGFTSRAGRGGARSHAPNGENTTTSSIEQDDSEVGQLKKKYGSKVSTIQELFPGWTDEDVVMALEETDGDLESTVERISECKNSIHIITIFIKSICKRLTNLISSKVPSHNGAKFQIRKIDPSPKPTNQLHPLLLVM